MNWRIYSPEGVQNQFFESCYSKKNIEFQMREYLRSCGYKEIESSVLDFFDSYSLQSGGMKQESMFKLVDERGRLLVLRPDMTIPVAKMVATKLKDKKMPIKAFYIGDTFRYDTMGGGRQKQFTQAGIEIIGSSCYEADSEVIITAIEAMLMIGFENFKLDLGQVEFFKGLMDEAELNEEEQEEVRKLIDSKNIIGLERLLNKKEIREDVKKLILNLPGQFGSVEILDRLLDMGLNDRCKAALTNLKQIFDIVSACGYGDYISVDLGMVQSLDYYTGLIFKGFTYGVGFPVLGGGRYDKLVNEFGLDTPATGFSLGINLIMQALEAQNSSFELPTVDALIVYKRNALAKAYSEAQRLRNEGFCVSVDVNNMTFDEAKEYCQDKDITYLVSVDEDCNIVIRNLKKDEEVSL